MYRYMHNRQSILYGCYRCSLFVFLFNLYEINKRTPGMSGTVTAKMMKTILSVNSGIIHEDISAGVGI